MALTKTNANPRRFRRVLCAAALLAAGALAVPAAAQEKEKVDAAAKLLMGATGLLQQAEAIGGPVGQGLISQAAGDFEKFIQANPSHKQITVARYGLGVCRFRQGKYDEAIKLLEQVRGDRNFEQADQVLAVLGHCYMSRQKHDQALKVFGELLQKHPASLQAEVARLNQAQIYHATGKHAEAVAACQAFRKKYPSSRLMESADFTLALAQTSLGKWTEASAVLTKMLRNPDSRLAFDAALLLGQCHEGLGKGPEAVRQFEAALKIAPEARKPEATYSLGVAQYSVGKYAEASKLLKAIATDKAGGVYAKPARLQLGLAQLADKKVSDARKTLSAVAADDPARAARARFWLAQCDMMEEKYDAARAILDELARRNPKPGNLEDVLYDRAECTFALGRYEPAEQEFAAFVKAYPQSARQPGAIYRRAFCLHKLEKYAESQPLCEALAARKDLPLAPAAAELAAENLYMLGKYPQATKAYEALARVVKKEGQRLRVAFRLTQCAYHRGDMEEAIKLARPLAGNSKVVRDVKLRRAVFLLGDAQLQTGKFREAAQTLRKYVPLAGEDKAEAQYKLGLAQLRGKDEATAVKTFQSLFSRDAKSRWARLAMFEYAQAAYAGKQPDKAAPVLAKLLAADPPDDLAAGAIYLTGWIDYDAKRFDDAARRFGELARRFPKHERADEAAYRQGVALAEAGKAAPALAALQAYVKARSGGQFVRKANHQAARCLVDLKRHDEAAKLLKALAGEEKAATEEMLYELAWAQRESKDSGAAATYRRLLKQHPNGKLATTARAELAELLYAGGDYAEAATLLEAVVRAKDAETKLLTLARYRLGWCYDKLGQPEKAAETFGTFAAKDSASQFAPSAMFQAGAAYAKLGKTEEAAKQFSALIARFPRDELARTAMLKLGEAQAQTQDYDASAATYADFLKKNPKSKFAYMAEFGIGWAMENRRKYDDARKSYEKVIAAHNGPTAARAQFQTGECYFAEGKYAKAVAELLKVEIVYDYPEWSARALYEAGRAFEALDQPDQARRQYAACVAKYKDTPAARQAAKKIEELKSK